MSRPPPHVPVFKFVAGMPMLPHTYAKFRRVMMLVVILVTLYLLLLLKYMHLKTKALDRIEIMTMRADKQLAYLERMDQDLDMKIKIMQQALQG